MIMKMRETQNDGLLELINVLPVGIVMAEIGSYAGESTALFINSGKVDKLYAIDPWQQGYDINDPASTSDLVEAEKQFDIRVKDKNVIKLKTTINEALVELPELDFVYIDGNHTYDAVLNDIKQSLKRIKKSGYIGGHDYRETNPIVMAVNAIFTKPHEIFSDSSWIVKL